MRARAELPDFSRISGLAAGFAEYAVARAWSYEEYITTAKEAWVVVHEDKVETAKRAAQRAMEEAVQP